MLDASARSQVKAWLSGSRKTAKLSAAPRAPALSRTQRQSVTRATRAVRRLSRSAVTGRSRSAQARQEGCHRVVEQGRLVQVGGVPGADRKSPRLNSRH